MRLTFLTPSAALLGLVVVLPVAAFLLAESRARLARGILRLPPPLSRGWPYVAAISAFAALVALGAGQPVFEHKRTSSVRSDVEAFFVFDTSRSMAAARSPGSPSRFDRARAAGKRMRAELPELPVGIASLTDRVLAHLFPTPSRVAFSATLDEALGVERPPPVQRGNQLSTSLQALAGMPPAKFFSPGDAHRLVVVFTDAESRPLEPAALRHAFRHPRVATIVVQVGSTADRVFLADGVPDPAYRPTADSRASALEFARATSGRSFDESQLGKAVRAARRAAGERGPRIETKEIDPTPLAAYAFGAAFLPLAFLLWRRNLR